MVRASGVVLSGRVGTAVASAVTVAVTARSLGASGRGQLTMILTIIAFLTLIASGGIPTAGRILLVDAENPIAFGQYFAVGLAGVGISAVAAPLVAVLAFAVASQPLAATELLLVSAYAATTMLAYLLVGSLYALGDAPVGAIFDGANYVVLAAATAVVAAVRGLSLEVTLLLFTAAPLAPIILSWRRLGRRGISRRPRFDAGATKRLLSLSRPSMAIGLGESMMFRADRLILGMIHTPAVVGVYSVAVTAAEMLRYVPAAVNQVLFHEQASGAIEERSVAKARRVSIGTMVIIMAMLAIFLPPLFVEVLGPEFSGAGTLFRILLLSEIGVASYLFDSTTLASRGGFGAAARVATWGLAIVLVFDLVLIPRFAGAGAAWASVIAYSSMAIVAIRRRAQLSKRGTGPSVGQNDSMADGFVERVVSGPGSPEWGEHRARYQFARPYVRPGPLLDIACGSGIGLPVLDITDAAPVLGIDVSLDGLHDAQRFVRPGLAVAAADGRRLPFRDATFATVTSFETIEHVPEPERFLSELARIVRPEGTLVLSTPNARFTKPVNGVPRNPFHLIEWTPDELLSLLTPHFAEVTLHGQRVGGAYGVSPYWELPERLPQSGAASLRVWLWKALIRLPAPIGQALSRLVLRRALYPGERDFDFLVDAASVAAAHVTVAVCRRPRVSG